MRLTKRGAAHLNFLDTSPLSVFASSLRSKQNVYIRMQLHANVNASIKGDREFCLQTHARTCSANILSAFVYVHRGDDQEGVTSMQRPKMTRVISFRITEEDWLEIERAAADCGDKPHDWCRTIALETARMPFGLTPNRRVLFAQIARSGFLVENGFQLLASDTLESEHWKRYRAYAKANLDVITNQALTDFLSNRASNRSRYTHIREEE